MPTWTWKRATGGKHGQFFSVGFDCRPAVGSAPDTPSSRLPLQVLLRLAAAVVLAVWWRTGRAKRTLWRGLRKRGR